GRGGGGGARPRRGVPGDDGLVGEAADGAVAGGCGGRPAVPVVPGGRGPAPDGAGGAADRRGGGGGLAAGGLGGGAAGAEGAGVGGAGGGGAQGGGDGAGVLRPRAARGDARCGPDRGARGCTDRSRADGRGAGVRAGAAPRGRCAG